MKLASVLKLIKNGRYQFFLWKLSPGLMRSYYRARGMSPTQAYAAMQKLMYESYAGVDAKQLVVGAFDAHEKYDYETPLLRMFPGDKVPSLAALDFGCGPGRMVKRMSKLIARCDGIDISAENIRQAEVYCADSAAQNHWYVNDGTTFDDVASDTYDLVYSTIALQHIPIREIRMGLLAEMYRVLKPGGWLSVQMAYAQNLDALRARAPARGFAHWTDNCYEANGTNGLHDVAITEDALPAVAADLAGLGFVDFSYEFGPLPHSKTHWEKWIFLAARKPG